MVLIKRQKLLRAVSLSTILIILLGTAARFWASEREYNYDFDSYLIVANIMTEGGNVYAEIERYNYGPTWMNIVSTLYLLAKKDALVFRKLLVAFLTLVDIGIFLLLRKKYGEFTGSLFFLSPISVLISGHHNQFDNLAILLGLLSVSLISDNFNAPLNKWKYAGLATLGFSLITKHLFFIFPLWLAVKQKGFPQKMLILLIPTAIFLVSFAPYAGTGGYEIIRNVFLYKSYANEPFYNLFVPGFFQYFFTSQTVWLLFLTFFGFYFRNYDGTASLLLYTCILVATSPAITNQYLSIVTPFLAATPGLLAIIYTVIGTLHLFTDVDGLHLWSSSIQRNDFYSILVTLLCATFIWKIWNKQILHGIVTAKTEIKEQIKSLSIK